MYAGGGADVPVKIVSKKKKGNTPVGAIALWVCSMLLLLLLVKAGQGDGDRHCQWCWCGSGSVVHEHLTV